MHAQIFLLSSAVASLALSAVAADDNAAQLFAYTAKPEHVTALMAAVRPYYALIPSCQPGTAKRVALNVVSPVSFDPAGVLLSGTWIEGVKVDGCTTSGLFNVLTVVRSGEAPLVGGLLPGSTRAPMGLQRDSLPTARSVAAAKLPGNYNDLQAIDTSFERFDKVVNAVVPAGRDPRSWHERWTFAGSGQQATATVTFVPDRTGTSFIANP